MCVCVCVCVCVYQTLLQDQDATQGQFYAAFHGFLNSALFSSKLVAISRLKSDLLFTHNWKENRWIHSFLKDISAMCNALNLVKGLY